MSGVFASPRFSSTALAFGLCLLAFLFAVEAKLAWFSPARGPAADIRAAKALPADTPVVVSHGITAPDPVHPLAPFVFLAAFAAACMLGADFLLTRPVACRQHPVSAAAYFFPGLFFRPPPRL
jgi:hypothetical protein